MNIDAAASGLVRGFGLDSIDALAGRLNWGLNDLALGKFADGRLLLEEVMASYERRLGAEHPTFSSADWT